jgi:hypothetical protein
MQIVPAWPPFAGKFPLNETGRQSHAVLDATGGQLHAKPPVFLSEELFELKNEETIKKSENYMY